MSNSQRFKLLGHKILIGNWILKCPIQFDCSNSFPGLFINIIIPCLIEQTIVYYYVVPY